MPGFTNVREERVETPFGEPSDAFVLGELEGRKVAFLARHGRGHSILPSELNFRANIYAFKKLGAERILSISAVGSLKEEHKPTDFVMPDQFIDRTFLRTSTFFGEGVVGHCKLTPQKSAESSTSASKADVSSLSAMLASKWKSGGGPAAAEALKVGQIVSCKISNLDPGQKRIELELA